MGLLDTLKGLFGKKDQPEDASQAMASNNDSMAAGPAPETPSAPMSSPEPMAPTQAPMDGGMAPVETPGQAPAPAPAPESPMDSNSTENTDSSATPPTV